MINNKFLGTIKYYRIKTGMRVLYDSNKLK